MSNVSSNIKKIKELIPNGVKIVAVSKTWGPEKIMEAYNTGHRHFGENRVQELLSKKDVLPGDVDWHMIGHLQTNKVKYIVPFVGMIHSVDSLKLLKLINSEAIKVNRVIDCLLQVHIASEEQKFGFSVDELTAVFESGVANELTAVRIRGLMGMATFTSDESKIRSEFRLLKETFMFNKKKYFNASDSFSELSMGMSGDFNIAIEEGSTIVRIGSIIFGSRT